MKAVLGPRISRIQRRRGLRINAAFLKAVGRVWVDVTGKGHCGFRALGLIFRMLPDALRLILAIYYSSGEHERCEAQSGAVMRTKCNRHKINVGVRYFCPRCNRDLQGKEYSAMSPSEVAEMFQDMARNRPASQDTKYTGCLDSGWMSVYDCAAFAHMAARKIYVYDVREDNSTAAQSFGRGRYVKCFPGTEKGAIRTMDFNAFHRALQPDDIVLVYDGVHFGALVPIHHHNVTKTLAPTPVGAADALRKHDPDDL